MTGGQNPKPTSAPGESNFTLSLSLWTDHTFTDDCWFALESHCDTGYLLYGDFCYYFETKMVKNWQDAEAHCTREQGHLASFHTEEELSFLIGELLREHIKLWLKWSISLTHSINADVFLSWHFDSSHARGSLGGFEWHQCWKPVRIHRWNPCSKC